MDLSHLTPEELEETARMVLSLNKPLNFGPFILGALFEALLCGNFLMQCSTYIGSRNKDGRLIKALVAFVIIMNMWGTAISWMWMWYLFVNNFGTYRSFFSITYLSWYFVINAATVIAVQAFFGFRAWKLMNSSRILVVVMVILAVAACAGGIVAKVIFVHYNNVVYANKIRIPGYICISCTLAVDLLITGIILQCLIRKRTINKNTNRLLSQLTKVTFESQLPPTLLAIALFCVYTVRNDSFVNIPLVMMQCKVYGISLLHTLNVRESLNGQAEGTGITPEGCAITSGALQQFDLERLTFTRPRLTAVVDNLPGHTRNDKHTAFQEIIPNQIHGTKLWRAEVDDGGSRSILTDDRVEDHDARFKATLV